MMLGQLLVSRFGLMLCYERLDVAVFEEVEQLLGRRFEFRSPPKNGYTARRFNSTGRLIGAIGRGFEAACKHGEVAPLC
jgi:hypothetical protein